MKNINNDIKSCHLISIIIYSDSDAVLLKLDLSLAATNNYFYYQLIYSLLSQLIRKHWEKYRIFPRVQGNR